MAHAIKIKTVDTALSQVDNKHFLDVLVEISDGEKGVVGTRRFAYPLDVTKEFILADLDKVAKTMDSDAHHAATSAKLEADLANAEELKRTLTQ